MRNSVKRAASLILVILMGMACLTGCTPGDGRTAAQIGDLKLTYGEANFYVRYNQSMYESYYKAYGATDMASVWSGASEEDSEKTVGEAYLEELKTGIEDRYVGIQVEGKLCIIEEGILSYCLIVMSLGCMAESFHGSDLVLGLDVAVAHLVIRYLAKRIGTLPHPGVAIYGTTVIFHRIQDRTAVEPVRTGFRFSSSLGIEVIEFLGIDEVATYKE